MIKHTRNKALDEATRWFARLRDSDVSEIEQKAFAQWRDENLAHRRAYEEIQALWASMDALEAIPESQKNDRDDEHKDARLEAPAPQFGPHRASRFRPLAAAMVLFLIGFSVFGLGQTGVISWPQDWRATHYQTAAGEQRTLLLEDGTTIYLNTRSRIAVDFSQKDRHVRLIEGEALFDVRPDAGRPFVVNAGAGTVRVLGTRFNIHLRDEATEIAVMDGHVAVSSQSRPSTPPTQLQGGEGARVSGADVSAKSRIDVASITAWREGRLIYRGTPLAQVVKDLNRYMVDAVRIGDDTLSDMRVTAVIRIEDREAILKALGLALPIDLITLPNGTTMLYEQEKPKKT
ncbi:MULTISPECIES: FecR family protein [unclassified Iodidimonas]|jgi:transmembrane sensor|uniref:FecR family protein n=1 Tax=unclassified Iodidimonas TaxID=2626145 RepID=UPI0024821D02|nr:MULTISPECIES: FecR family protein [unclassified Iodidimonas]